MASFCPQGGDRTEDVRRRRADARHAVTGEPSRRAAFQVVAVYPSGNRYAVRAAHDSYGAAVGHVSLCERDADPRDEWTYEIDVTRTGADGETHCRQNVQGEDLGYTPEEVDAFRWYRPCSQ